MGASGSWLRRLVCVSRRERYVNDLHFWSEKLTCLSDAHEKYDLERIPLSGFSAEFRRYGEFRATTAWVHGALADLSACAKSQGDSLATKAARIIPEIIPGDAGGEDCLRSAEPLGIGRLRALVI